MAAFLQWRRFVFFDKETVKDPGDAGKGFTLPAGISACDSGRGHIVLGDILSYVLKIKRTKYLLCAGPGFQLLVSEM